MKAVFEVEFKMSEMIDRKTLKEQYKGSLLKCMRWLYDNEGLGIFDKDFKLTKLKK